MKKENKNNKVILNLIQDLQRLPLQLINNMRGRSRIKYGMTSLYNNGAFTLIELLVVVLIIGILAEVAVPQYQKAIIKSRYATLKNVTHDLAQAQELYYLANGSYTSKFDKLSIDTSGKLPANGAGDVRMFSWGSCGITSVESQHSVQCKNEKINMMYQIHLIHGGDPYLRGKTICLAYNTDVKSSQNEICRQETNKSTYYSKNTEFISYLY